MKILVAVDGSQASLCAVRHALQLLREGLRADIVLAAVQEPTYVYELVLPPSADVLERLSGAVGARALADAEALLAQAGVAYTREIGSGDPAPTLVEIAERCGCAKIVMGARGLGAVRGALLGSVSQSVLQKARMPVTIVKDDTHS
jgi:nucleotide-binding universal stress UspA family protein